MGESMACQSAYGFIRPLEGDTQLNNLILDSGISVAPWINVAPETFGKNNKYSPLKKHVCTLHQITEFWTFFMDCSL